MKDSRLGRQIGEGGCSEVYEWEGTSRILKLAKPNTSAEALYKEYMNMKTAWELGLPAPRPYDFVQLQDRPGLVQERIDGETLMNRYLRQLQDPSAKADTQIDDLLLATAQVLHLIHRETAVVGTFSLQRASIKDSILRAPYLTILEKSQLMALTDSLPVKHQVCHGDPNPSNMIIDASGKVTMIDWMNASIGNPEADLAEYILMIRYAVLPSHFPSAFASAFETARESIITTFMAHYSALSGVGYADVLPWLMPLAARKLTADAIPEEEKKRLLFEIRRNLKIAAS